jgi:NADH-quinone oxidoreductase subunit M
MEGLMIGVFAALDALLFYVFWEAMLIPMFIIIGVWGGPRRVYATIKFFLYTFLGSVLMLVALIYMYLKAGDYEHRGVAALPLTLTEQTLDLPGVPAGVRGEGADVAGAHLAAGRARRGAHRRLGGPGGHHAEDGRLRLPALQPADRAGCQPRARLADHRAVADRVVYIGFVALVQQDMKKLIAYSSIAHMGFVTLGACSSASDRGAPAAGPGHRNGHRRRRGADAVARPGLRARCSCASASCTTGCTAARSAPTAA